MNTRINHSPRRFLTSTKQLGTNIIHKRSPFIVMWWSLAFPGFGHFSLGMHIQGFCLFVWEIVINVMSGLNEAIVYSFTGNFEMAAQIIDTRWIMFYIPMYGFAAWDSYRSTVELNKIYEATKNKKTKIKVFEMGIFDINYIDKGKPHMALYWSLIMPGLGQLYSKRIINAFFLIIWFVVIVYFSNFGQSIMFLINGEVHLATSILNKQWLLFLPSIYGFALYDSYVGIVESNKLQVREQIDYFENNYQSKEFQVEFEYKED